MIWLRVLQRKRVFHSKLNMLTERIYADRKGRKHLGRREHRMHAHADKHDHSTDLIERFRREHIECCKDNDQQYARQFAEKLRNPAIHLSHADDLHEEIIHHALV